MKLRQCQSRRQLNRKFEAFFGAWPFYCAILWNALRRSRLLEQAPTARVNPRHLLMGLHFLKAYNTEERSAVTFGCDEKTFRQWAWFILSIIAKLETKFVSLGGWRGGWLLFLFCLLSYQCTSEMFLLLLSSLSTTAQHRFYGRIDFESTMATEQQYVLMAFTSRSSNRHHSARIGIHTSLVVQLYHMSL